MKFLKMEEKLQWKLYYIVNEDLAFKKSYFYVIRLRPMRSNWRKGHLLATIERVKQKACCPNPVESWLIYPSNISYNQKWHFWFLSLLSILWCHSTPKPLEPEYIFDFWEYRVLLSWKVLDQSISPSVFYH